MQCNLLDNIQHPAPCSSPTNGKIVGMRMLHSSNNDAKDGGPKLLLPSNKHKTSITNDAITSTTTKSTDSNLRNKLQRSKGYLSILPKNQINDNNMKHRFDIKKDWKLCFKSRKVRELVSKIERLNTKLSKTDKRGAKKVNKLKKRLEKLQKLSKAYSKRTSRKSKDNIKHPMNGRTPNNTTNEEDSNSLMYKERLDRNRRKINKLRREIMEMKQKVRDNDNISDSIHSINTEILDRQRLSILKFSTRQHQTDSLTASARDLMEEKEDLEEEAQTKIVEVKSIESKVTLGSLIREVLESTLLDTILPLVQNNCKSKKLVRDVEKIIIKCQKNTRDILDQVDKQKSTTKSKRSSFALRQEMSNTGIPTNTSITHKYDDAEQSSQTSVDDYLAVNNEIEIYNNKCKDKHQDRDDFYEDDGDMSCASFYYDYEEDD